MDEILSKLDDLSIEQLVELTGQSILALLEKLQNTPGISGDISGFIDNNHVILNVGGREQKYTLGSIIEEPDYIRKYQKVVHRY